MELRSASVYGWCGGLNTSAAAPTSMSSARYITPMRSEM